MKTKWLFVVAGTIFLLLILAGCAPGTPTCSTASLQAPVLNAPPMWEVVSTLSPSLTWTYPDGTCNPEGYRIDLKTGPLFTDDLGGGTGNPSTSWGPGSPLQPGKEYAWGVQAINGTTLGPYAGSSYFFTGPMCDTAALTAPALLQPANGASVNTLDPSLIWQYPDSCLPQGYRVDLSVDVTFADTSLSGGTGNPSTRWGPGDPLADCTVYFWRIAPINDTTLGPFSGIFSFETNTSGACPTPTPVPTSTPTLIPTPTFTPTPVPLFFDPIFNAYCRFGPDPVFDSLGLAMKGQRYPIEERNSQNNWYWIVLGPNLRCWVSNGTGAASGDTSGLPVRSSPPTPTPTLVPTLLPTFTPTSVPACSNYTDIRSCEAQNGCGWQRSPNGGGVCVTR